MIFKIIVAIGLNPHGGPARAGGPNPLGSANDDKGHLGLP
jgi:hypothetical protein